MLQYGIWIGGSPRLANQIEIRDRDCSRRARTHIRNGAQLHLCIRPGYRIKDTTKRKANSLAYLPAGVHAASGVNKLVLLGALVLRVSANGTTSRRGG
jgi:hypothetical protein